MIYKKNVQKHTNTHMQTQSVFLLKDTNSHAVIVLPLDYNTDTGDFSLNSFFSTKSQLWTSIILHPFFSMHFL